MREPAGKGRSRGHGTETVAVSPPGSPAVAQVGPPQWPALGRTLDASDPPTTACAPRPTRRLPRGPSRVTRAAIPEPGGAEVVVPVQCGGAARRPGRRSGARSASRRVAAEDGPHRWAGGGLGREGAAEAE